MRFIVVEPMAEIRGATRYSSPSTIFVNNVSDKSTLHDDRLRQKKLRRNAQAAKSAWNADTMALLFIPICSTGCQKN
jgi:hypothetical protein